MRCIRISLRFILMSRCRAMRLCLSMCIYEQALMHMDKHRRAPLVETRKFQFVDLKQNTLPYIAVMRFGAWLLIFLRKEQYRMKLVLAEKPSVTIYI